jgi:hypothetical protein
MTPSDPHRFPDDLQDVVDLLRDSRPEATALELDGIKRQAITRVRKGRSSMKSRFAIMAMLVSGLLVSGTGAGLAVSGIDGTDDASVAQYGTTTTETVPPTTTTTQRTPAPCDENQDGTVTPTEDLNGDRPGCADIDVLPTNTSGGDDCDTNGDGVISPSEAAAEGCGGVKGETDEDTNAPASTPSKRETGAQPTRQAEANGADELPFTGFAAVPILIGGIALLAAGLVLRRRTAL